MNKKVEAAWQDYRRRVIPEDVSGVQVQEYRQAFYAGVFVPLDEVRKAPSVAGILALVDGMTREVVAYVRAVVRNEA